MFLVFGFGPIAAGLFLYEAQISGAFDRLVVAYRNQSVIDAVRVNGGVFSLNIARADRVEQVQVGPVEMYNVNSAKDRRKIIEAVSKAGEIATALGSIKDYQTDAEGSVHRLLAKGLQTSVTLKAIYAAENHNHAAEKLRQTILLAGLGKAQLESIQFLNTVIGKMSVRVSNAASRGLEPIAPNLSQAFLAESFNHILVSQVSLPSFKRGLRQFQEKPDLLPFEEAKLYGHNAVHALAAYLCLHLGLAHIRDLEAVPGALTFLRTAFIEESGAALVKKHAGVDALFTPQGYAAYAADLLKRMMNPFLNDSAERVGRDPLRKLGWEDRLIGTMRVCLNQNEKPERFALGTALAMRAADINAEGLLKLWPATRNEAAPVLNLIQTAQRRLSELPPTNLL